MHDLRFTPDCNAGKDFLSHEVCVLITAKCSTTLYNVVKLQVPM